jgi:16S rRNA (cytidine1402-2'-O)-methyltransferase
LPRQGGPRRAALRAAGQSGDTLVVFESPHRVRATLEDVRAALGDRRVAVCRELTKLHEEIWRGPISEALAHFAEPRGEFTLVIEGGAPADEHTPSLADTIRELRRDALGSKEAISELAHRRVITPRDAYRASHELPEEG